MNLIKVLEIKSWRMQRLVEVSEGQWQWFLRTETLYLFFKIKFYHDNIGAVAEVSSLPQTPSV